MATLTYREDKSFFDALDRHVNAKEAVTILISGQRPDKDSALWKRLARCENWSEIEAQLRDPAARQSGPIGLLAQGLTGGEIALIAWLGTLLIGLLFYAAYKSMRIKVRVRVGGYEVEIDLSPA